MFWNPTETALQIRIFWRWKQKNSCQFFFFFGFNPDVQQACQRWPFSGNLLAMFCFFKKILICFFLRIGFPSSFIFRSRSNFLFSQWKSFELYVRTCPSIFFSSLYLLITFCIFTIFTFDLWLTSLTVNRMNFNFFHLMNYVIWWVLSKSKGRKRRDQLIKLGHFVVHNLINKVY